MKLCMGLAVAGCVHEVMHGVAGWVTTCRVAGWVHVVAGCVSGVAGWVYGVAG